MYDPENPSSAGRSVLAAMVGKLLSLKYGRDDELEADKIAVQYMPPAGYDPRSMIAVMKVLASAGKSSGPEFFQTHPNPNNRVGEISRTIEKEFPTGIPAGLAP